MTTYEKHFGLKQRPFAGLATGNGVFVAPKVAKAVASLKKALATEDAIVTVSGPVGSGKTTIARCALDGVGKGRLLITIGRIQLHHDEVLELLLAGLGARQLPKSTVHRFAAFRRLLHQYAEQNKRVFILVEDATRVGVDALSELEALTAADAGVSGGANLILLGDRSIDELMRTPPMGRTKQRIRSRQVIEPQDPSEMKGYLTHCFRLAGQDLDAIFASGSVDALHRLSDGLPRVINGLVDSALTAAADQKLEKLTPELMEKVAGEEFGLTVGHSVKDIEAAIEKAASIEADAAPEPVAAVEAPSEPEPATKSAAKPSAAPPPEPPPEPSIAEAKDEIDEIPDLIQDTLPDLTILSSELVDEPEPEPVPEPEPTPEPEPVPEPEPAAASDIPAEARNEDGEIPDWERDQTMAELQPDLDALERAMAVAQGTTMDLAAAKKEHELAEVMPDITLDNQIQAKIEEAAEELKQAQNDDSAEPDEKSDESDDKNSGAPAIAKKDQQELQKIAEELAKAKTIEDVDDKLAETLFGEEFSMMAAQVTANGPDFVSANDSLEPAVVVATGTPTTETDGSAAISVAPASPQPASSDASTSQTLSAPRGVDKPATPAAAPATPDLAEAIVAGTDGVGTPSAGADNSVGSFEDQMNMSMTQTMQALNVRSNAAKDDDNDDEKKGFFSRFRRK